MSYGGLWETMASLGLNTGGVFNSLTIGVLYTSGTSFVSSGNTSSVGHMTVSWLSLHSYHGWSFVVILHANNRYYNTCYIVSAYQYKAIRLYIEKVVKPNTCSWREGAVSLQSKTEKFVIDKIKLSK